MLRRDWQTTASLVEPAELARNRAAFDPIFVRDSLLSRRIMGNFSQARLGSMTDVDFNARLYAFHTEMASQGTAFDRFTGVEILGAARPSADTAYVVYRWLLPAGERPIRSQNVAKVVRADGRWWLSMLADFEGFRTTLLESMERVPFRVP